MDTTKKHFIERASKIGILFVRERNAKNDFTSWGALEFVLNNGEIFIISGRQFGQGSGENGLWVDMNKIDAAKLTKIKQRVKMRKRQKEDTIQAWLKHQITNIDSRKKQLSKRCFKY